jgi:hypothetical protein
VGSERLALICSRTLVLSERVKCYNRQTTELLRKTKLYSTYFGPGPLLIAGSRIHPLGAIQWQEILSANRRT